MFSRNLRPFPFRQRARTFHDATKDRVLTVFSSTVQAPAVRRGGHANNDNQGNSSTADQSPPAAVQTDPTYVL